jgi:hypothetical protein
MSKVTVNPERGISIYQTKTVEKDIHSFPTHNLLLSQSKVEDLLYTTCDTASKLGIVSTDIPADIIFRNTIPTWDFCFRLPEAMNIRIRVIITHIPNRNKMKNNNSVEICGAVIFDFGVTKPMRFFGVNKDSNSIVLLKDIWWYGAKNRKDAERLQSKLSADEIKKMSVFKKVMQCWYAIELHMLFPELYHRSAYLFANNTYIIYDDTKYFPDPVKCKTHIDYLNPKRKTYIRHKLVWHRIGHNKYVNGKIKFIQGVWCFAHNDDGKVKMNEFMRRVKELNERCEF